MKQKMKQKLPRLLAALLVGILTITDIGVVPAAAEDGNSAEPVVFQQVDFEGLTASDGDDVSVVIGKINGSTNPMTVSMASETGNKYATLMGGKKGGNFFILRKYTGQETSERVLNAADVEPVVDSTKSLWITMDIRLGSDNYGQLTFWTRGTSETTLDKKAFFYLKGDDVYNGGEEKTDYTISATEWTTIVCEINPIDGKYRTYIVSDGELGNAIYEAAFTAADINAVSRFEIQTANAETTANVQLDNIAIYQSDEYVDLFAEDDEPEPEPTYVAQIGDDKYETLQGAIDAANNALASGNVTSVEIDLQTNVTASADIEIISGVTLDLNANTLNMGDYYLLSAGNVVDSSADKSGRLKIATETVEVEVEGNTQSVVKPKGKLAEKNSQMPVYIDGEGYMFASMTAQSEENIVNDLSSFNYISRPSFGATHVEKLQSGASAAGLQFILRLDWGAVTGGVYANNLEFSYSDELVEKIYTNGTVFSVNVSGLTNYASSMKVSEYVISDLGVKFENNSFYMSGTTATN